MRRVLVGIVLTVGVPACDQATAPNGPRCGPVTCSVAKECCNASCGTCVDPGSACTLIFCGQSPCASDAECRLFSFVCATCECWALRVDDPSPLCPNPSIQCLVDPCAGLSVHCDPATHRCAVQ